MFSKRTTKIVATLTLTAVLLGGGFSSKILANTGLGNTPSVAYAQSKGLATPTGVISKFITSKDKAPENPTLDQMLAISKTVTPESNPELFSTHFATGDVLLDAKKMYITDTVYHQNYTLYDGSEVNNFIQVLSLKPTENKNEVERVYNFTSFVDGILVKDLRTERNIDAKAYEYMMTETKEDKPVDPPVNPPVDPSEPTEKVYSSKRLAGLNRVETALSIANEYTEGKLDNVVVAYANNFPDALSGSVLADELNAPILLFDDDTAPIVNFLKSNLKQGGKVTLLGGTSVLPASLESTFKGYGYATERLAGLNRYSTNLEIVNKLNPVKGQNIVVANADTFADSLSVSSIASIKDMPIFLTSKDYMEVDILNKIKELAPKNIYVVGGTSAISSGVVDKLANIGAVTRIAGENRYETSLEIAKYFNLDTKTATIADGKKFPDALAGSVFASKKNAPIILVNDYDGVELQKKYLDSTKISSLYFLGGTSAISSNTEKALIK